LMALGFCVVPYVWLWIMRFPLFWVVAFPLATLPALVAAYRRPPGRQGVVLILAALCYTLLFFLIAIVVAYAPPVLPR